MYCCGVESLYVVRFYHGEQLLRPFWYDSFKDENEKTKYVKPSMACLCTFAQFLQGLDVLDSGRLYLWLKSFWDINDYFSIHHLIVRRAENLLSINADDHDLSKTRVVQIALESLWHWLCENDQSSHMKQMAFDTVGYTILQNGLTRCYPIRIPTMYDRTIFDWYWPLLERD